VVTSNFHKGFSPHYDITKYVGLFFDRKFFICYEIGLAQTRHSLYSVDPQESCLCHTDYDNSLWRTRAVFYRRASLFLPEWKLLGNYIMQMRENVIAHKVVEIKIVDPIYIFIILALSLL
jgi:hypothetical protein